MNNRYEETEFLRNDALLAPIPRVAAIHDISCIGRCALTVIIPVLSALGIQAVPLPTALLSTHTGGYENMFFKDMTHHMKGISEHWKTLGADFDAIYSGFLGSEEQIDMLLSFIRDFSHKNDGKKTFIAVDPVMGDDGELYSTYTDELVAGMKRLCVGADLITPNLTEACFLLDKKIPSGTLTEKEADDYTSELATELLGRFGCERIVITGTLNSDGEQLRVMNTILEKNGEDCKISFCNLPHIERSYPGTGDVFASVVLGTMLLGSDFENATKTASNFICEVTHFSERFRTELREGLVIEPCLGSLTDIAARLKKY